MRRFGRAPPDKFFSWGTLRLVQGSALVNSFFYSGVSKSRLRVARGSAGTCVSSVDVRCRALAHTEGLQHNRGLDTRLFAWHGAGVSYQAYRPYSFGQIALPKVVPREPGAVIFLAAYPF